MNGADPILRLVGVTKSFGDHCVLDGIDLDVFPHDVVAIIGRSGSGKSTLLKCINFLEPYDGGSVFFNGELVGYCERDGKRQLAKELLDSRAAQAVRDGLPELQSLPAQDGNRERH